MVNANGFEGGRSMVEEYEPSIGEAVNVWTPFEDDVFCEIIPRPMLNREMNGVWKSQWQLLASTQLEL
jgi:hypothetical protein